jgi:acetyltransferase-like isoleucine patch superfamily enzyme
MDRKVYDYEVGEYTYGHEMILVKDFELGERLKIGKFCSMSSDITIFLGGGHIINNITTYPFGILNKHLFNIEAPTIDITKDVIIGNDVWIAHGATIMSGVKISDGSVIAANSHVHKDIGPYEVWGGNPAKFIKKRFTDDQISKLVEIKWWDLDIEYINKILSFLISKDIEGFINFYNKI